MSYSAILGSYLRTIRFKYVLNYTFIHIPKTGGTSVEAALNYPFRHNTAVEERRELGTKRWKKRFSFTIVRNPWDRLLSFYLHELTVRDSVLAQHPVEFNEWVRTVFKHNGFHLYEEEKYRKYLSNQWVWVSDEQGHQIVDYIIRFENIRSDFAKLVQHLNMPGIILPHLKKTKRRRNYDGYYDPDTKEIIGAFYVKDLEKFGYHF